ncbi:MAG: GNAT family N-acetyltransferase [Bacteroidetes bacterium]|nr:GNAT family N-acetyltransferase [Bacteroidota bacterium]
MTEIRDVTTSADLKKFITFPHHLYKGNPYWCPPIIMDEKVTLSPKKNHAFEYCEARYWLAYKDGQLVGRVAGIINPKANQRWGEDLVRFGWIDFIDDPEVSQLLIDKVSEWGRARGMKGIHGPLGFTDMDNEGMIIEGFDQHCTLSSIYNYPYYVDHMVRMGFGKATDWIQYEFDIAQEVPDKVERTAKIVEEKFHLRVLKAKRRKDLMPYALKMFAMLNHAFDELYGFAAINEKQMEAYVKQYFGFIRPEFVAFVLDPKDEVVGFGVSMPSVTAALQKTNGRFFPFGWIHLLRSVYKNEIIDMYLVGVHPDYQGKGAAALVWRDLHRAYLKYGIKKAYSNPQLEDNTKALSIWKNFNGKQTIRRRCWVKHF